MLFQFQQAADGVIGRAGAGGLHQRGLGGCGAGAQHFAFLSSQPLEDTDEVVVSLAAAKNDLGKAGPQPPVGVELGVAQFLKRRAAEVLFRLLHAHRAVANLFQNVFGVHGLSFREIGEQGRGLAFRTLPYFLTPNVSFMLPILYPCRSIVT